LYKSKAAKVFLHLSRLMVFDKYVDMLHLLRKIKKD